MKVKLVLIVVSMVVSTTVLVAQKVEKKNPSDVLAAPAVTAKHIILKQRVVYSAEQDQHMRSRIQIRLADQGDIRNTASITDRPKDKRVIYISKDKLRAYNRTGKDAEAFMELAKQRSRKH